MSAERLLEIIIAPHISEKTSRATEKHQVYTFKVAVNAAKPEIKQAIEKLFNTKVEAVRTVTVKPKTRRFRGVEGSKKKWKKAYVTLAEGQKIDLHGESPAS
ncbi:MAG TPA: 50S ribosomal protein L23 [Gammaproteobacteria bacterium]|nr:50S ribosomal protein L23 [Gammaproteobacteria bacterium]